MGHAQSKRDDSAHARPSTHAFVCHYELLHVSRDATADEVKKAYRQQALLLHPDKNMHRVHEATELFSRIQNAYQILSDPQERAFYDRHRDSIIRKQNSRATNSPTYSIDDLMPFFDNSAFQGFSDGPRGFFAVYRALFALLEDLEADAEAEAHAVASTGHKPTTTTQYTSFGAKHTPFEPSLRVFYDKFMHFSTARPFYEADGYDDTCAENRRHRRAIDKENQRLRDIRRREFNDTVRSLAIWVRKRDPRWQTHQAERNAAKQAAANERKAADAKRRLEQAAAYVAPDWVADDHDEDFLLRQLEKLQLEIAADQEQRDSSDEGLGDDELYCSICKKVFKNVKQWHNHEQSKKHRANMLKAGFVEEEVDIEGDGEGDGNVGRDGNVEGDGKVGDAEGSDYDNMPGNSDDADSTNKDTSNPNASSNDASSAPVDYDMCKQKPPKKKNRQKKTTATIAAAATTTSTTTKPSKKSSADDSLACKTCHTKFASRNALFKHINDSGHAALKAPSGKRK